MMTKTEYRKARRMVRVNGAYAYKWMTPEQARIMRTLRNAGEDWLAIRARWHAGGHPRGETIRLTTTLPDPEAQ